MMRACVGGRGRRGVEEKRLELNGYRNTTSRRNIECWEFVLC